MKISAVSPEAAQSKAYRKPSPEIILWGLLVFAFAFVSYISFDWYPDQDAFFLLKPLPIERIEPMQFLAGIIQIMAIISGIGVLLLRDIYRKGILLYAVYGLYTNLIEFPLIVAKNVPAYVQYLYQKSLILPPLLSYRVTLIGVWITYIFYIIVDTAFCFVLLYFFMRPDIRIQFQRKTTEIDRAPYENQ